MQISAGALEPHPPSTPPVGIAIGTIAHPARRIPPLAMVATRIVGQLDGWSSLTDAWLAAVSMTTAAGTPMVAVLLEGNRYVLRDVLVNMSLHGDNWRGWHLEGAIQQAGPARVDWSIAPASVIGLVDGRAQVLRPV